MRAGRKRGNRVLGLHDVFGVRGSRLNPADETRLASDRSEVRNPHSGTMMTGHAEVALEGWEHLDLARKHRAFDLAMQKIEVDPVS